MATSRGVLCEWIVGKVIRENHSWRQNGLTFLVQELTERTSLKVSKKCNIRGTTKHYNNVNCHTYVVHALAVII